MASEALDVTVNDAMFNKLLKSFGKKTSKRDVEDYLRCFESLNPYQVATQLIAIYYIYSSLARNAEFVDAIQSTGPDDTILVHNMINQLNKFLNENPYSFKGHGLKFWIINLRCMRDKKLKEMGFKLWYLAQFGMAECRMIVLADIKEKQISGDNLAAKSGKKVVKNIGYIPPYFR